MVMSNSASGDNQINAFPAEWKNDPANYGQPFISKITFSEADEMARQGEHAAQILMRAYPGVKIELIHYPTESKR